MTDGKSEEKSVPTGGYGVVNLRTSYLLQKGKLMHAGVENVFDKYYSDHLGGINRVAGSDVPIGSHIPGAGRFVYLAFDYRM